MTDMTLASEAVPVRKVGYAPIKQEYLLDFNEVEKLRAVKEEQPENSEEQPEETKNLPTLKPDKSNKKYRGMDRDRGKKMAKGERDARLQNTRLCLSVIHSDRKCKYGNRCVAEHTLEAYLEKKPEDLGDKCPVFEATVPTKPHGFGFTASEHDEIRGHDPPFDPEAILKLPSSLRLCGNRGRAQQKQLWRQGRARAKMVQIGYSTKPKYETPRSSESILSARNDSEFVLHSLEHLVDTKDQAMPTKTAAQPPVKPEEANTGGCEAPKPVPKAPAPPSAIPSALEDKRVPSDGDPPTRQVDHIILSEIALLETEFGT
ncbi:hypothetical protein L596_009603 [Steinernema carpocapsae]|uniref:Uncharacterized protein n=1 Tax=Steinernema carpocapsae TaxID=34508 RepID=A0A4U5PGC6_STECR|nr:hypothetical protein L596_009603 [Steinernema carpocapsae]